MQDPFKMKKQKKQKEEDRLSGTSTDTSNMTLARSMSKQTAITTPLIVKDEDLLELKVNAKIIEYAPDIFAYLRNHDNITVDIL